jgi:hypothetical protein
MVRHSHGVTPRTLSRARIMALLMVASVAPAALAQSGLGVNGQPGAAFDMPGTMLYAETFETRTQYPEWSSNFRRNAEARASFSTFNGRNGRENITLTLPGLPALPTFPTPPTTTPTSPDSGGSGGSSGSSGGGGFTLGTGSNTGGTGGTTGGAPSGGTGGGTPYYLHTLRFDLYVIDSWDGGETSFGVDKFLVRANGAMIFDHSFANQTGNRQTVPFGPTVSGSNLGFNGQFFDSIYRDVTVTFRLPTNQPLSLLFTDTLNQPLNDESWGIDNVRVSYSVVPAPGAAMAGLVAGAMATRRRRGR